MKEYSSIPELAELIGVTTRSIRDRWRAFEEWATRPTDFIHDGRIKRANTERFITFMNERRRA